MKCVSRKKGRKIVILVPPLNLLSGISLHFSGLRTYWTGQVSYFVLFKKQKGGIRAKIEYVANFFRYVLFVLFRRPDVVVFNLSLKKGFYSKNLYFKLTKMFSWIKVVTFIHGWDVNCEPMLETSKGKFVLRVSDAFIVLSRHAEIKLREKKMKQPILLSTTKVEDCLLDNFDIKKRTGKIKNFLFLSRVERAKGIFLALDIFKLLQSDYPDISFSIAGQGKALSEVRNYVEKLSLHNVRILGRVEGDALKRVFQDSDCFFLLSETEGMPAAMLEAMAFGLFVVTTPVGGIPDIFEDGTMGIMSSETSPYYYYCRIKEVMSSPSTVKAVSEYNYNFAKEHFYASVVAKKVQNYLENL